MVPETDAPYARAAKLLREASVHLSHAKALIFDVAVIHEEEPIEDPEHAAILRSKACAIGAYIHVLKALEISCARDSHLFGEAQPSKQKKEPRPDLVMLCQATFGQYPCQLPAEHSGPHRACFGPENKSWIEWLGDETGVAARVGSAALDLDSIQIGPDRLPPAELDRIAATFGCLACPGRAFGDAASLDRHIRAAHPSESIQEVAQP